MISRKINWLSSIDTLNATAIASLEERLADFYSRNPNYYGHIDFTSGNWVNEEEVAYHEIAREALLSNAICEFGCGNANILKYFPLLADKYSGCDFSEDLMKRNRVAYEGACFRAIEKPNMLPFGDAQFDLVFSVFVLEHSTSPARLLDECNRILKPGGKLMLLCPDFLGQQQISSQRAGWTAGTTSAKFREKRVTDALLTLFDNRVRIPYYSRLYKRKAVKAPQFFINVTPTVFEDPFIPDVDAVYLTCREEIIQYMEPCFILQKNGDTVARYTTEKKLIFLAFNKK